MNATRRKPRKKTAPANHSNLQGRWAHGLLWAMALSMLATAILWARHAEQADREASRRQQVRLWSAGRFRIHGIDVSIHQGRIQWERVARATLHGQHISFAFIKCTEGITLQDRQYARNMQEARAQGICTGAYHYYKPEKNIEAQARNFIEHARLQEGDLAPVLDVEEAGRLNPESLADDILRWMKIVGNHYQCTPILYTGHSFRKKHLTDARLRNIPLWKAHYQKDGHVTGKDWAFYQYTKRGQVAGIKGRVDLDVFHGSPEDLKSLEIPLQK